jgi:hypothetical protein
MTIRRSTSIVLLSVLLLLATVLARNSRVPGISGRVEEIVRDGSTVARTVPRPRADVLIVWRGNLVDNPFDSRRTCLGAVQVVSSTDGRFALPGWWKVPSWPPITDVRVSAYVFVPGYATIGPILSDEEARLLKPGVHLIKRDASGPTREQWLQESAGCGGPP